MCLDHDAMVSKTPLNDVPFYFFNSSIAYFSYTYIAL